MEKSSALQSTVLLIRRGRTYSPIASAWWCISPAGPPPVDFLKRVSSAFQSARRLPPRHSTSAKPRQPPPALRAIRANRGGATSLCQGPRGDRRSNCCCCCLGREVARDPGCWELRPRRELQVELGSQWPVSLGRAFRRDSDCGLRSDLPDEPPAGGWPPAG